MATTDLLTTSPGVGVARVESMPFGENTYILFRPGAPGCIVVDPGFEPGAVIDWIDEQALEPQCLLLTHGHSDHIAGNAALRARWPAVPIWIGRHEAAKLTDPQLNLSAPFGLPLVSPPADRLLDDGETIDLAGFRFTVRWIPGHSSGHVVFVLDDVAPPVVLGGDVLFQGSVGRTDFPDGDAAALAAGIRRHLYTLPDSTIVLPGHGDPTTVAREKRHNPFVPAAGSLD